MENNKKEFLALLLLITLLGICLRVYGVFGQPLLEDETLMASTARNYMERGHFVPSMPHHPNLRNILVFLSMNTFGENGLGVRFFSLLFGILSVPLLGLLLYRLTSNVTASSLAAFFLAVDPVHILYSRHAIQEVHTAFFFLAGTLLFVHAATRNDRWWLLPASGVFFGFGLASKAHAAFPLLVCLVSVFLSAKELRKKEFRILAVVSLTVLPLTVFMLTDAAWFSRGYDLADWLFMRKTLIGPMTAKFTPPTTEINVDTLAWQWFLVPFLGYHEFSYGSGKPVLFVAMGNPLVWMLVLPAAFYILYRWRSIQGALFMQALFWLSYLPLVVAPRRIFLLSSIAVTPFAYGLVGLAVSHAATRWGKKIVYVYLGAVLAISLLLYPLTLGQGWNYQYLRPMVERFNPHQNR